MYDGQGESPHAGAPPRRPKRTRRLVVLAGLTGLAVAGTLTAVTLESGDNAVVGLVNGTAKGDPLQRSLNGLVDDDEYPGALAAVWTPGQGTRHYTAGVGDLKTKAKVPRNGRIRIASNTKMFTATVVLQLVGEGKIQLDAPIEKYLPGMVRGNGNDGRKITVRQLLQHTSGLADYDEEVGKIYPSGRHTYFEPRELVDWGLARKALFPPGKGWAYSNTNYVLAGLIVEKAGGRPVGEQITKRIIDRAGLRRTYWPAAGDQTIRGAHPHGYFRVKPTDPYVDVTTMDPSTAWAAGQLISTPTDLNRFLSALLRGRLLKPKQLKQMKTTVAAPDFDSVGGSRYGLGLGTFKLSCGGFAWTHGGDAPGYSTRNAVKADGRAASVAVTALPGSESAAKNLDKALDTALCR